MHMTLNEFKLLTSTCWNEKYQPLTIDMTKDRYQGRHRLGINNIFVPDTTPFQYLSLIVSIYSNVSEQDLINLRKLAEQQKEQRALKIKNRILKQTHDIKLAESFSPITKRLDEVNKSTEKVGDILKETSSENKNNQEIVPVDIESEDENIQTNLRALPNSSMFSDQITKALGRPMSSSNPLKTKPSPSGATILGVPINTLGGDRVQIKDNNYDLTPEIYKALSYTGYTGNTMKNEADILMMNNIKNDLGYTGLKDYPSKRKTFPKKLFQD